MQRIKAMVKKKLEILSFLFLMSHKKVVLKKVIDLDEFTDSYIRQINLNFYVTEGCILTLRKLILKLKQERLFSGRKDRSTKLFKATGFKWKKLQIGCFWLNTTACNTADFSFETN